MKFSDQMFTKLTYLDLSFNQIEKLLDFSKLKKLKYLNLSNNAIRRSEYEEIKNESGVVIK